LKSSKTAQSQAGVELTAIRSITVTGADSDMQTEVASTGSAVVTPTEQKAFPSQQAAGGPESAAASRAESSRFVPAATIATVNEAQSVSDTTGPPAMRSSKSRQSLFRKMQSKASLMHSAVSVNAARSALPRATVNDRRGIPVREGLQAVYKVVSHALP
jgi:hypothetical protein